MNKNGISLILFSFLLCACQQQQKKTDYPLFSEQKEPDKGEKAVIRGKIRNLQVYPHVHDIKLMLRTSEAFTERDAYYSFIPQLEEAIDRTIIMTDYYNLVERLNMLKLRGTDPMPKTSDVPISPKESIHLLHQSTDNPFLAQFTVASYLSVETRANSTQTIDVEEEELQNMINDSFLRAMMQKEYNRVKNYVANPRIFSDAVMENNRTEITGASILPGDSVNVMKRLVEVNSGKALYVDVWAPWCHPCLTEMPYSQELYDHFEGEPLTFVYLCMGGSREQWQDVIASYALSGLHIYLSESEWLDLMKRFHIKGIPHYLLFNTEGVMIDFGGHLRPGNPETKAAIERALQT